MDFSQLLAKLLEGNNPIFLLIAFFLFKDQIFAWFKPKPVAPPAPAPPGPTPPPAPVTPDQPFIDAILKILPTILPLIVPLLTSAATDVKKAQSKETGP